MGSVLGVCPDGVSLFIKEFVVAITLGPHLWLPAIVYMCVCVCVCVCQWVGGMHVCVYHVYLHASFKAKPTTGRGHHRRYTDVLLARSRGRFYTQE